MEVDVHQLAEIIDKHSFGAIIAFYLVRMLKQVWSFCTEELAPVLADANTRLISLIDALRLADQDGIRMTSKLITVLQMTDNDEDLEEMTRRSAQKSENAPEPPKGRRK